MRYLVSLPYLCFDLALRTGSTVRTSKKATFRSELEGSFVGVGLFRFGAFLLPKASVNVQEVAYKPKNQTSVISVTSGGQLNLKGAVTPKPTLVYSQVSATR